MRTFISLLALAAVATSAPASPPSSYASAYSYQNINRNGYEGSYDIEVAVKGQDYKGEPLDFNARESKSGYNTEGEYYAVLPQGWMCVAYAVGEGGVALKYDCATSAQGSYKETPRPTYKPTPTYRPVTYAPPTTPSPPATYPPPTYRPTYRPRTYRPYTTPAPYTTTPAPYTTTPAPYTPRPTYPTTTEKPAPRMVKVIYETYLPEDLANHPDTFELQHKHPHDNYHHTIPLTRISTHPTDVLYDHPIHQ